MAQGPNGGRCASCVAGKYKAEAGSAGCSDCGSGTFSAAIGARSAATCSACPANSDAPAVSDASTDCTCNAGFSGPDGGMCQPIPTSTTSSIIESTTFSIIMTTPVQAPQEVVITAVLFFSVSPAEIVARKPEFEAAIAKASGVSCSPSALLSSFLPCPPPFLGLLLLNRNVCVRMRMCALTWNAANLTLYDWQRPR